MGRSRAVVVNPNWNGSTETFCVGAVEAQLLCRPVLGGRADGLLETVGHGRGGLLSSSQEELKQNLLSIIEHPALAAKLGTQGYKHVTAAYDERRIFDAWKSLLQGCPPIGFWAHLHVHPNYF
jgi:glycosyltransferase involved in cell wall biosynthesis